MEEILAIQPSTFPLRKLPFVALKHVIKVMEIDEILKTAVTSKYMECVVKSSCIRVEKAVLYFDDMRAAIFLKNPNLTVLCIAFISESYEEATVAKQDLKPWLSETSTVLETTLQLFLRIRNLFQCGSFDLQISLTKKNSKMQEIMEIPDFRNYERLSLSGRKFEKDEFDYVMEFGREDQKLRIIKGQIPEDYYHPNLFKYTDVHYCDSRWIRLEHLLSIKDNGIIRLENSKLTQPEINTFLRHWVNSEHDMFRQMEIVIEKGDRIHFSVMFRGLVALLGQRFESDYVLIAVKSPETRKQQILSMNFEDNSIFMFTWAINERVVEVIGSDDEPYAPESEILRMLERKKGLKMELKKDPKKLEIRKEIDEIEKELCRRGMTFLNGWPTFFKADIV
ncbi:hypothetical protein GCK72_003771 [Caenorhabditis remanei]|uniref:F-box domain-containing protein n=1 Tax=Caenorhabditis remanei TaxID=31234 RepID=A0A6A5H9H1_CAERE|nr:hypothetical protein GCK72_003771 [Caenorhabditis remanei]KAF1763825.1 hypothetical protein GCK72_003771 [Caenorhabditis remanei]